MSNNEAPIPETTEVIVESPEEEVVESEVKRLPFKELIKRIGPGMILTGVVVGPGSITTAAVLGSQFGYKLLWLLIVIFVMGFTFAIANHRIAMLTGKPIMQVIDEHYGRVASIIVGISTFVSGAAFTISNFTGTGMGVSLILPISWKIGATVMALLCILVIFKRSGVYKVLEKAITVCVFLMIAAFLIAVIAAGGPKWGEFGKGFIPTLPEGSLAKALAFVSTSATVTTGMYGTYLGREKKWKKRDLFNGAVATDSVAHVFSVCLITLLIVLTGAIVLNPTGTIIKTPQQLGELLVPALGKASPYVVGLGILGAAFSSLLATSQRTAVLMLDSIGKPYQLDKMATKIFATIVLIAAAIVGFIFGRQPVQLILVAQICTSIATPVAGLFLTLLLMNKKVNKGYKTPKVLIALMITSYLLALVLTVNTVIGFF